MAVPFVGMSVGHIGPGNQTVFTKKGSLVFIAFRNSLSTPTLWSVVLAGRKQVGFDAWGDEAPLAEFKYLGNQLLGSFLVADNHAEELFGVVKLKVNATGVAGTLGFKPEGEG